MKLLKPHGRLKGSMCNDSRWQTGERDRLSRDSNDRNQTLKPALASKCLIWPMIERRAYQDVGANAGFWPWP